MLTHATKRWALKQHVAHNALAHLLPEQNLAATLTGGPLASDGSASLLEMLTCLLVGPGAPSFSPRLRPILKKCCVLVKSGQNYIICDVDSGASHLSSSSGTYRHLHSLRTLLIARRPKKYFLYSTIGFAIMLLCLNQAQI